MTEGVVVAFIVSVIGPAVLILLQRRANGRLADKIGEPNGHGSLVAMVQTAIQQGQQVIQSQADQDSRLASIEYRQAVTEGHVHTLHGRLADVEKSLIQTITPQEAPQ